MTVLREFHRSTGHNKQVIRKKDIVVVHDDAPRLHWKLAIVEEPIKGNDGLVCAARIRTDNCTTTRPIVKLYPLEVMSNDQSPVECTEQPADEHPAETTETTTTDVRPAEIDSSSDQSIIPTRRAAATTALRRMKEWTDMLCCPLEDVEK